MAYSVMAINPGHNGSVALVVDGKVIFYGEEERFSRVKHDGNPFKAMIHVLLNYPVDEIVLGGTTPQFPQLPWTLEDPYSALARKFNPNIKITNMGHLHHLGHAAGAFYNSGFESAAAVIVDGAGSFHSETIQQNFSVGGFETESIYQCEYPHEFNPIYKRYSDGNSRSPYFNNGIQEFDNSVTITKAYEGVSDYLGFGYIEAGKTMGLAPYGQENPNIPAFFLEGKGNKNLLIPDYPAGSKIDESRFTYLKRYDNDFEWHKDFSLVRDVDKDLAYHIQKETEEQVSSLIEKAADLTGETNIVIAGGYGLNCVANYKFVKKFPNLKIYADPISHDGGTSIGLAKYAWYHQSHETKIDKLTTVYLSMRPDYNQLNQMSGLPDRFDIVDATNEDVAKLIEGGNIVTLFQGQSEGGPRALGNRSILYDPRDQNGKEIVNRVKHREWFRPFAGSVLEEHANDWFDMAGMESSPFMMYAVNVREDKVDKIPAVTHVDNTCRVQTVNKEDNANYYDLINEFYKLTGVPILFNTSFNLAGQPLVESVFDAVITVLNSEINYLYLPELGKLMIKKPQ